MKPWRLREFHPEDLDQLVEVWRESRKPGKPAVHSLSEVLSACTDQQAVVAGERLIGAAAATIEEDRAWVIMLAQAADWRDQGLGSALLSGLESRLMARGVLRISALVRSSE